MINQGFKQCTSEPCLYYKNNLFAVVHVDDTLTTGEEKLVEEWNLFFSAANLFSSAANIICGSKYNLEQQNIF
jgi:hypothetical protein